MTRALAPLVPIAALTACATGPRDYAEVLPDERILINLPVESGAAKDEEEKDWSEAYLLTARVTDDVNGLIGGVLLLVDYVTDLPPTWANEEETKAAWGPYADALDPVETMLWVEHFDDDHYEWAFVQKPKGAGDDEYVGVVGGTVEPGATREVHAGAFAIDFTTMNTLDPNVGATGLFASEYEVAETGVSATAAFDAFDDGQGEADAVYAYDQTFEGEGQMDLAWLADANGDVSEELWTVRSRWTFEGAGRSDATLSEGSLGDGGATAAECWNTSFETVYTAHSWDGATSGAEADCAFVGASYAGE